jgi:hypothetical protein
LVSGYKIDLKIQQATCTCTCNYKKFSVFLNGLCTKGDN